MTVFERWWIWHARAACAVALARCGGADLVRDACTEATWYADMLFPWDGAGPEPDPRVFAWLSIFAARRTLAGPAPEPPIPGPTTPGPVTLES